MPFCKIYLHLVWATKNRAPLISDQLKPLLLDHIRENAQRKEIYIDSINCVKDHIHLLLSLGTEQTISKVVMLIKGESSYWVNKQELIPHKFEWQDEYYAGSISPSALPAIRKYIHTQEEHHARKTFMEEYEEFMAEDRIQNIINIKSSLSNKIEN